MSHDDELTAYIESLISEAEEEEGVQVKYSPGIFIQLQKDIISDQKRWDDRDPSKRIDFTTHKYWLTTDDGAEPVGFDDAQNQDVRDILEQYMGDNEGVNEEE